MIDGPISDATTITPTMIIPATARRFRMSRRRASAQSDVPPSSSSVSNSWIDERICNINGQVEKENDDRYERDNSYDQRFVSIQIRIDEILSEPWQGEHAFHDNRSRNENRDRRTAE